MPPAAIEEAVSAILSASPKDAEWAMSQIADNRPELIHGAVASIKPPTKSAPMAENPISKPKGDFPPEGRFFPLARGAKLKPDWSAFWEAVEIDRVRLKYVNVELSCRHTLKDSVVSVGRVAGCDNCGLTMRSGVERRKCYICDFDLCLACSASDKVERSAGWEPPRWTAAEVVSSMKRNFGTNVLATMNTASWAKVWAYSLKSTIMDCVETCSSLLLLAVQGGPACEEEVAFVTVLLQELGFKRMGEKQNVLCTECIEQAWVFPRQGGVLVANLAVFDNVEATEELTRWFVPDVFHTAPPNLTRLAIVSCAEKWPPKGGQAGSRLNEDGETVSDVMNRNLLKCIESAESLATEKGFAPKFSGEEYIEFFEAK